MNDVRYLVINHPENRLFTFETFWCDDYKTALEVAQDWAEELGEPVLVMERAVLIDPPTPVPLEEYYDVKPGVDFPGTLNK